MAKFEVFFQGEIHPLGEAGALLVRQMIEEDLPDAKVMSEGWDPYQWLARELRKNPSQIRRWTYDWDSPSGVMPTIIDFLRLIIITKSTRAVDFFAQIIEGDPVDLAAAESDVARGAAEMLRGFADDLEALSEKIRSNVNQINLFKK